jgi:hypothetical protein
MRVSLSKDKTKSNKPQKTEIRSWMDNQRKKQFQIPIKISEER